MILKAERGVASCGGGSQLLAPGGPGSRPPGTTTWLRGARCTDPEDNAGDGSAAPGEKPPRWSAERRASRVMGRKASRKRLTYRVISAFTRVCDAHDTPHGCLRTHPNVSRRSAHPSIRGERSKVAKPGRKNAPRERDGLFDMVKWNDAERFRDEPPFATRSPVLILRSARTAASKRDPRHVGQTKPTHFGPTKLRTYERACARLEG